MSSGRPLDSNVYGAVLETIRDFKQVLWIPQGRQKHVRCITNRDTRRFRKHEKKFQRTRKINFDIYIIGCEFSLPPLFFMFTTASSTTVCDLSHMFLLSNGIDGTCTTPCLVVYRVCSDQNTEKIVLFNSWNSSKCYKNISRKNKLRGSKDNRGFLKKTCLVNAHEPRSVISLDLIFLVKQNEGNSQHGQKNQAAQKEKETSKMLASRAYGFERQNEKCVVWQVGSVLHLPYTRFFAKYWNTWKSFFEVSCVTSRICLIDIRRKSCVLLFLDWKDPWKSSDMTSWQPKIAKMTLNGMVKIWRENMWEVLF